MQAAAALAWLATGRVEGSRSDYDPARRPANRRDRSSARSLSAVSKGIKGELYVAQWLQQRGWLVASRRHVGGAGDLLAVREWKDESEVSVTEVWLIEVKHCKNLWENFRKADREEMKATKLPKGGERWLVNVLPKRELDWRPESSWP